MKYHQLSDKAKAVARQWFKDTEGEMWGQDRAPDYYEDMAECVKFLGITIDTRTDTWTTAKGQQRSKQTLDFEWSGFWSQGDGLVFQGKWKAEDVDLAGLQKHTNDAVLHHICTQMMALMLACPTAHAKITTVSYGPGLPAMHVDEAYVDSEDEIPMATEHEELLTEQVIAAAHWCYKQLEDNYEYDTGDEAAESGIEANEYDFNRDGERITRSRKVAVPA